MPITDTAAVALAREGDSDAFRGLVERHSRAVYRLAHRMTGNPQDAEDVVQETFLKAYKQLGRFESRSNFGTWLHRIAVNEVLTFQRNHGTRAESDGEAVEDAQDAPVESPREYDSGEVMDVERALATLPPGSRHVVVLQTVYGYSHEEVADMLGIAVGTCKAQLHRGRRLLRERMGLPETADE